MTTYQDWLDAAGDLVYSLFGVEGQLLFQEYSTVILLVWLGLGLAVGLVLLRIVFRFVRGKWLALVGDFPLLLSRDGRRVLSLSGEIRRGVRRLRRIFLSTEGEEGEYRVLLALLERFVRKDLPEALVQAHSFIETGGTRLAADLEKALARQEELWAESAEPNRREELERRCAETRQRLLQARESNAQREKLLKGLAEAALALRTLELEMASLGATRSSALSDLREQLDGVSEGLHHQRQAYAEFDERA